MKVVYHIGMHATDEDAALKCLLRNGDALAQEGTVVPIPARFKPVLREAVTTFRGRPPDRARQEQMLQALTDEPMVNRIVFSNENFLCPPVRAVEGGDLYPLATERSPWLRNLFPEADCAFMFGIRNPATLLPALFSRFAKKTEFETYMSGIEPEKLSWVEAIERFRIAVPDVELTIWCNEDTPLIWPEVLGALSNTSDPQTLDGAGDFLASIMTDAGITRMAAYLESHPPKTPEHRRRVTSAFLDKFARSEAVELEFDLPNWTEERIAHLTARYEADIRTIREMSGINFIAA